jgi:hypothetical protein
MKLMHGDELRLRYLGELHKPWSGVGHVIKIPDNFGEEVGIELKNNSGAPTDCISHFVVDFIWKSTSFDRLVCPSYHNKSSLSSPRFPLIKSLVFVNKTVFFGIVKAMIPAILLLTQALLPLLISEMFGSCDRLSKIFYTF